MWGGGGGGTVQQWTIYTGRLCPKGVPLVVLFCAAYTLLTRPNQVETAVQSLQFLAFSLDSIMSLSRQVSFLRSVSHCLLSFYLFQAGGM